MQRVERVRGQYELQWTGGQQRVHVCPRLRLQAGWTMWYGHAQTCLHNALAVLGPSHTRRPNVSFRAAHQRRYKILLLRPVCGVCAARQLGLISGAWRQNHASRGIELVLFLTRDARY